jgi:hypothetical protein
MVFTDDREDINSFALNGESLFRDSFLAATMVPHLERSSLTCSDLGCSGSMLLTDYSHLLLILLYNAL